MPKSSLLRTLWRQITPPPHLDIVPLSPSQSHLCADLHEKCFSRGWNTEEMLALIRAEDVLGHGVLSTDFSPPAFCGFILSRFVLDEAEILTIAIEQKMRRKGMAAALLDTHLSALVSRGIRDIFLEVSEENTAALALYERFDFKQVGSRQGYYPRPNAKPATALILRRNF